MNTKGFRFVEMDPEIRKALIESTPDVLGKHVPKLEPEVCPECGSLMEPQRPASLSGLVPKWDYKCPKCKLIKRSSGVLQR